MPGGRFSGTGTIVLAAACGARGSTHSSLPSPTMVESTTDATGFSDDCEPSSLLEDYGSQQLFSDGTGCLGMWAWASVVGADDVRLRRGRLVEPRPFSCVQEDTLPRATENSTFESAVDGAQSHSADGHDCSTDCAHTDGVHQATAVVKRNSQGAQRIGVGHSHGDDADDSALACDSCRIAAVITKQMQPFTDRIIAWERRMLTEKDSSAAITGANVAGIALQAARPLEVPLTRELAVGLMSSQALGRYRDLGGCTAATPMVAVPPPPVKPTYPLGSMGVSDLIDSQDSPKSGMRLSILPPLHGHGGPWDAAKALRQGRATPDVPYLSLKVCLQNVAFGRIATLPGLPVVGALSASHHSGDAACALIVASDAYLLLKNGTTIPAFLPLHPDSAESCQPAVLAINGEALEGAAAVTDPLAVVLAPYAHAILRLTFPFLASSDRDAEDAAACAAGVPLMRGHAQPSFEPDALEAIERLRIPVRAAVHPHPVRHVLSLAFPDDGALWRGYRTVNAHMVVRVQAEA